jgi:hypothetical protein
VACLAPDVAYEVGQKLPASRREEVRAMWARWETAWEDLQTVPEEFIDAGACRRHVRYRRAAGGAGSFRERSDAFKAAGLR